MNKEVQCSQCGVATNSPAYGCNMPEITDGPVYLCSQCCPTGTAEEIIASIESFMIPSIELQGK